MTRPVLPRDPNATTIILVGNGPGRRPVFVETEERHSYLDAVEELWTGIYGGDIAKVYFWSPETGFSQDVTRLVAETLAERTFERGETPPEVEQFCQSLEIDTFDLDRHAHMLVSPNAELRLGKRELGLGAR